MLSLLLTSISLTFDQLKNEYRVQNGCSRSNEDMDVSMFHCSNNEMMEHMTNWTTWLDTCAKRRTVIFKMNQDGRNLQNLWMVCLQTMRTLP